MVDQEKITRRKGMMSESPAEVVQQSLEVTDCLSAK